MLRIFAVYDIKAKAYAQLICLPEKGLAIRAFADSCKIPDSPFAKYPADFTLRELGTYDPNSGKIEGYDVPEYVAAAADFVENKVLEGVEA